jgi:hypothetical protein
VRSSPTGYGASACSCRATKTPGPEARSLKRLRTWVDQWRGVRMDLRMGRRRYQPDTSARAGADRPASRHCPDGLDSKHCCPPARDADDPDRLCNRGRSRRQRHRREAGDVLTRAVRRAWRRLRGPAARRRAIPRSPSPTPIHRSHGGDLPRGGSDVHGRRRTRAESSVVTTPGGTGTGAGLYTYVASPTVTSVAPTSGPTRGVPLPTPISPEPWR